MTPLGSLLYGLYKSQYVFILTMYLIVPFLRNSTSNNGVTLKSGLGMVKGHWKWRHLMDLVRLAISLPL